MTDQSTPGGFGLNRRHFLQTAGTLALGLGSGLCGISELLAAPPAVPRNTAFLNWIAGQTKKPARFSFCVMGDNRPNTKQFDKIANLTNNLRPSFNVHVGDLVEGGTSAQWNLLSPSLQAFIAPMIATLGNHDRHLAGPKGLDLQLWGQEFGARDWDFVVGGWHFVGFDTSMGRVTEKQIAWLDGVLADDLPTMVFTHYPPSVERWGAHALYSGTTEFLAILAKHTVEHLFVGHNHLYDEMQLGPTKGVITAGAGSALYKQFGFGVLKHHVTHVAVEGPKVEIRMIPL